MALAGHDRRERRSGIGSDGADEAARALEARLRASFQRQTLMQTLAAELSVRQEGRASVVVTAGDRVRQQHGFVHAGIVATALDTACGYAAMSVLPAGGDVLTASYTINLLAPCRSPDVRAEAEVVRPGRTLIICRGEAHCDGRLVAVMQATMVSVDGAGHPLPH